jgi:hypothetical protein
MITDVKETRLKSGNHNKVVPEGSVKQEEVFLLPDSAGPAELSTVA